MRYCAINIGSNSSKMLIATCNAETLADGIAINKQKSGLFITGVGKEVYETGQLTRQGINSNVEALKVFNAQAKELLVDEIWVTATAAVRAADNADVLCEAIYKETGLKLEVISYLKEANLAFKGVCSSHILKGMTCKDTMIIDSGGASTELIYSGDGEEIAVETLDMGSLTLTNEFLKADPPSDDEINEMISHIDKILLNRKPYNLKNLVAVGGAVTSMAMVKMGIAGEYEDVDGMKLSLDYIESIFESFRKNSLEEIRNISGMPQGRAQTIIAGMAILWRCMRAFNAKEITISSSGILEGMIIDMAQIETS